MDILNADFSQFEGTNCYCSAESAGKIREALREFPAGSICYIGTGDYHYISLFRAEMLDSDFTLVLFDNHSDDQKGAFDSDVLSCGNWVLEVRRLPRCKGTVWLRNADDAANFKAEGPIFLSIDLDVLSTEYARTDWDQGSMTLPELCNAIRTMAESSAIIATDICGGISESKGGGDTDREVNAATINRIADVISGTGGTELL